MARRFKKGDILTFKDGHRGHAGDVVPEKERFRVVEEVVRGNCVGVVALDRHGRRNVGLPLEPVAATLEPWTEEAAGITAAEAEARVAELGRVLKEKGRFAMKKRAREWDDATFGRQIGRGMLAWVKVDALCWRAE
jgi:hypothetical protein